jgi:hypothetical protein
VSWALLLLLLLELAGGVLPCCAILLATWAAGEAGLVLLPVLRLLAICTAGEGVEPLPEPLPLEPVPLLLLLAMLLASCTAGDWGVLPLVDPFPLPLPEPLLVLLLAMLLASCIAGGGRSPFEDEDLELLRLLDLPASADSPAAHRA